MTKHWFTARLLSKMSKNRNFALDMGCGLRNWDEFFKCEHVAIDIKKDGKPDVVASGEYLPFREDLFDLVTSMSVIPYVVNYDKYILEARRVLKNKGIFYIVIMNLKGLALNKTHDFKNRFNYSQLLKILKIHGFVNLLWKKPLFYLFSRYYDKTSVYAYYVMIKN